MLKIVTEMLNKKLTFQKGISFHEDISEDMHREALVSVRKVTERPSGLGI